MIHLCCLAGSYLVRRFCNSQSTCCLALKRFLASGHGRTAPVAAKVCFSFRFLGCDDDSHKKYTCVVVHVWDCRTAGALFHSLLIDSAGVRNCDSCLQRDCPGPILGIEVTCYVRYCVLRIRDPRIDIVIVRNLRPVRKLSTIYSTRTRTVRVQYEQGAKVRVRVRV